jgi:hypothetical protein
MPLFFKEAGRGEQTRRNMPKSVAVTGGVVNLPPPSVAVGGANQTSIQNLIISAVNGGGLGNFGGGGAFTPPPDPGGTSGSGGSGGGGGTTPGLQPA